MSPPGHPGISIDPGTCGGKPVVTGTRMRVMDVVGLLAGGVKEDEILDDYPWITSDDIRACLHYAAEAVSRPIVPGAALEAGERFVEVR